MKRKSLGTFLILSCPIIILVLSHGIPGEQDGAHSAPPGTMVSAIQSMENQTFYINGRAPPYSTAKPVRFIVIERDGGLLNVPISELTWGQCHAYPNWTGPIKVPAGKKGWIVSVMFWHFRFAMYF